MSTRHLPYSTDNATIGSLPGSETVIAPARSIPVARQNRLPQLAMLNLLTFPLQRFLPLALLVAVFAMVAAPMPASALDTVNSLLDSEPPTGKVVINRGATTATSTIVSVGVPATDSGSGLKEVRLSNSSATSGGLLRYYRTYSYTSTISWNLIEAATGGTATSGTKSVYAQWKDKAGNWSTVQRDSISLQLVSEEAQFLKLINAYRTNLKLPALKISPRLTKAARWMSADMGAKRYFSHTDSLGRTSRQRMTAFGYTYNTYTGENIAAGYSTAQSVFQAWVNSPGHLKNIKNPNYRAIGIGRVYTTGSPYGWYWTTDFGGYVDQ